MTKYQSLKGMDDILPGEVEAWQVLEKKTRCFLEAYGFREIRTPIVELTELFARTIGEASDIIHKEMYCFEDRGGRRLTLRPEMTASIVRASLEHHLLKANETLALYYMGSMYRAERPQAGRKREFYQIGVETLNAHSAENDAELVIMAKSYFDMLGLPNCLVLLNNLGTTADRKQYAAVLTNYFDKQRSRLCRDCQYRLTKNVIRIFDCKQIGCQPIIRKAPVISLSSSAAEDFEKVQTMLKEAGVPFRIERKLVRGLDYYTGCVYEVTAEGLGSQNAVLAGGRYDGLIQLLGGQEMGASGFALGVERLLTALEAARVHLSEETLRDTVYIAAMAQGKNTCLFYRRIAQNLALCRKRAHFVYGGKNIGGHLSRASKMGAAHTLIVGEDEFGAGEMTLKNMADGKQKRIVVSQLAGAFGQC